MAINGAWRAAQSGPQPYASAAVWGTGVNPIHGRYGNGSPRGVIPDYPPADGNLPENLLGPVPLYGYTGEDHNPLYGYGYENGTADRPALGQSAPRAAIPDGWPEPGEHTAGLPGGTKLRSQEHGGVLSALSKLLSRRPVYQGMAPKGTAGPVNDSETASDRQFVIQTGMVQLDTHRAGSQRSGSQSEYNAPIQTRVPGMRVPQYAGGERHDDMRPVTQFPGRRRPFWTRTAGTADPTLMRVNAMYQSVPLERQPPPNPDTGATVPAGFDVVGYGGYTLEDPTW